MENIINKSSEAKPLLVFCSEDVSVKDKTTFDSCVFKGIHVTFWMEDEEDVIERTNRMFDILFNETVKSRDEVRV